MSSAQQDKLEHSDTKSQTKSRFQLSFNDILAFSSRLHVSRFPFFLQYKSASLAISGEQTREVLQVIQPGDVLARFQTPYLDRHLLGGTFQEMAVYLGKVTEVELKKFAHLHTTHGYATGEQMVIYATPKGLVLADVIDFCRCDGLAVMRLPSQLKPIRTNEDLPIRLYNYFNSHLPPDTPPNPLIKAERDIATHLSQGKNIKSTNILPVLYRLSLNQLGKPKAEQYDFLASFGIDPLHTTVSTAFIYFIWKSFSWQLEIEPRPHTLWRKTYHFISADTYVDNNQLEEVWKAVG